MNQSSGRRIRKRWLWVALGILAFFVLMAVFWPRQPVYVTPDAAYAPGISSGTPRGTPTSVPGQAADGY